MRRMQRSVVGFLVACGAVAGAARAAGEEETFSAVPHDLAFGEAGTLAALGNGGVRLDFVNAAAFDAEGRLLVAGGLRRSESDDPFLSARAGVARLLADGSLDRTFGSGGVALLPLGGSATDVAVDARGGILLAGAYRRLNAPRGAAQFQLAKLRPDGRLDRRFSGDGLVALGRRRGSAATKVRVAADGTLRLLVSRDFGPSEQEGVVRLSARGAVRRRGFGDRGFAVAANGTFDTGSDPLETGHLYDIAVLPDGSTVLGTLGSVRLMGVDGALDADFGVDGFAVSAAGRIWNVRGVEADAAGRILCVGGDAQVSTGIFRLDASGHADAGFAEGGVRDLRHAIRADTAGSGFPQIDLDSASGTCAVAQTLTVYEPLSWTNGGESRFAAALDLAAPSVFETHPYDILPPLANGDSLVVNDVAVAPDGRSFVVVGATVDASGTPRSPHVERFSRDGAVPLPRTNLTIAFQAPPTVEYDEDLGRWFLVATVRVSTTEPASAPGAQISLFLSDDDVLDVSDTEPVRTWYYAVGPNDGVTATIRRDVFGAQDAPALVAGRRLIAVIDGNDRVLETDETDNVAVSDAFE